ncbi:MAG: family 78 glycoside hydrolase catalytic domain [Proteiniphilum sp.]|jgi:alpha-L-rhamnosidase|nr:family 78 glycoside hydrolase catalytic domain [Proteiniphilum sp.]MDD2938191.1 family 78 glycoside hydrolase catalytic domain [Proteiniphilum sp.]MDD3077153.1 family 78 glycoside hydrolase catalytic domain [Proteiniphilum sp.]MDD3779012.1 family 78 glycoside hydrolase catalytic domain [Proteiniphilum sp.]MDD3956889.1 family 78 glycoside hydrolase catalytic domain [Proteiniphilum sp.]
MKILKCVSVTLAMWFLFSVQYAADVKSSSLKVVQLKAEYQTNPIGIDYLPQLSWQLESNQNGVEQTAYQIIISSTADNLANNQGDIWDSGKVYSSLSSGIHLDQLSLISRQRYHWKVKVWQQDDMPTAWSEPAYFETGLLLQDDWKSGWIGYVPGMPGRVLYFKGTFVPSQAIKQARAYIAGLGYYELYVNRKKVGDHLLDPAQSNYSKRVYYVTYDLGDYLQQGGNSFVIPVAPGWLGTPRLRIQIEITYQDNSMEILTSDRLRSVTTGPTLYSTIFDGEHYDARLESDRIYEPGIPPGLMDKEWAWSHNTDDPVGEMVAQKIEPIRVVEEIQPTLVGEPSKGIYVFDAGRNLAGWAALSVKGEAGRKVTLRFSETLYENGMVNQDNLRNAKAEDSYTFKGDGIETWEPAFTYHGFRFVQVEGLPSAPKDGEIVIKVVRSDVKQTGSFRCSNPLLNEIHQMVVNTEASNLHSVPTDCPQRDERMGWLNDMTVRIEQAIYNFNLALFYPKFMDDIEDTQAADGTITCVAPFRFGMRPADPVSASYLILAEKCYEFYGNKQIILDHFEGMKKWVNYLYARTDNGIVDYSYYGDWCPPRDFLMDPNGSGVSRDTPGKLMSTGYLYYCSKLLSRMGNLIDRQTDASYYEEMANEIYHAFNREYWNEEIGGYAANNQACNAFALYLGMADKTKRSRVLNNLVNDVKKHDYHLTTGNLCTKYLLEVLTENGFADVAYKIATQKTYPSWGFMLANGATTLWERWEYLTGDAMNSHNHPMMGSVGSWFYKYILGITPEFDYPGFERFTVKPYIMNGLDFAEGELETIKGTIKTKWKKEGNLFTLDLTVPANTKATIHLPARNQKGITINGKRISNMKGIELVKEIDGYTVVRIGSGNHQLISRL